MNNFRLNPFLVIDFYKEKSILLTLLNTNRVFEYKGNIGFFIKFIELTTHPITEEDIRKELADFLNGSEIKNIINSFIKMGVLISNEEYDEYKVEIDVWLKYKWINAFMYHIGSSQPNYIEPKVNNWESERHKVHHEYLEETGMIDLYKNIDTNSSLKDTDILPLPNINLLDLFRSRKTVRNFNNDEINFKLLYSTLYYSLFQVIDNREKIKKYKSDLNNLKISEYTPFEFYIVVFDVEGVKSGVYHYNLANMSLDLYKEGIFKNDVKDIQMGQAVLDDAKYAIYITADYSRQMWRYRYSHKLRLLLIQAGKIAQQIINISLGFEIGTFMSPAIKDTEAEKLLGLDNTKEGCVYFMCFGKYNKEKGSSYCFNNLPDFSKNDK